MPDQILFDQAVQPKETAALDDAIGDLLRMLLVVVVEDLDQLSIESVALSEGMLFRARCSAADVGKIIGRKGLTARSIRTILCACAAKNSRRYSFDIVKRDSIH